MAVFVMNNKKFPTWLLTAISLLPFAFLPVGVFSWIVLGAKIKGLVEYGYMGDLLSWSTLRVLLFALTVVYSAVYTKLMITTWRLRKNDAAELAKEKFAHWAMYSLLYTVLLCFMFYQMILELKNSTLP